jgi:hypothetical protein
LYQLSKVVYATTKAKVSRPPLLVPLTVASLALFLESVYFGIVALAHFAGNDSLTAVMTGQENWFLIKLLIAVSGVLLLFNLKIDNKK